MAKKAIQISRGKRKEAIARATVAQGTGTYTVNAIPVSSIQAPVLRELYLEPLSFFDDSQNYNITVTVRGGGSSGQAQAARTAVSKALLLAHGSDEKIKQTMLMFDRSLLVEDSRRVEPKKFKGPKARARFTKSYR